MKLDIECRGLKKVLKENPKLIDENLSCFESIMTVHTKEQITNWWMQVYSTLQSGGPNKTFGDKKKFLDRLDEDGGNAIILEEAATWCDTDCVGF